MAGPSLRAIINSEFGCVVITLRGEINGFAESVLINAYKEAIKHVPKVILISFEDVDYINSTGLALLAGLLREAWKSKRKIYIYGLSDYYQEMFRITRLADFLTIFPDKASALTDLVQ